MEYESATDARSTLAENIQRAHRLASMIEEGLMQVDGVLSGMGQAGQTNGAAAPSCGLLGDAASLADRLERIVGAVGVLNGYLSAPNVVNYPGDTRLQSKAEAEAMYRAQAQAASVMGGLRNY